MASHVFLHRGQWQCRRGGPRHRLWTAHALLPPLRGVAGGLAGLMCGLSMEMGASSRVPGFGPSVADIPILVARHGSSLASPRSFTKATHVLAMCSLATWDRWSLYGIS